MAELVRQQNLVAIINRLEARVADLEARMVAPWNAARGLAAAVSILTAPVGSIGSTPADTGLSVTFTSPGTNRQFLIWALARLQQGGAAGDQTISIADPSNVTLVASNVGVTGTLSFGTHTPWNVLTFAAGSQTVHVRAASTAGATLQASASSPALLAVFDVGPA